MDSRRKSVNGESNRENGTMRDPSAPKRKDSRRVSFHADTFPKITDSMTVIENEGTNFKRGDNNKVSELNGSAVFSAMDIDRYEDNEKFSGGRRWYVLFLQVFFFLYFFSYERFPPPPPPPPCKQSQKV